MSFEAKAIKLLDGNIREILCDTGVVNGFFDMTLKAQNEKKMQQDFTEILNFHASKDIIKKLKKKKQKNKKTTTCRMGEYIFNHISDRV